MFRFCSLQLAALEKLLHAAVIPASLRELSKQTGSFLLLGPAGSGKTTILQILCAQRAREYLIDETNSVPILYPLRYWRPGLELDEAILRHVQTFTAMSRRSLVKTLSRYSATIVFDGADEIAPVLSGQFKAELERLRGLYPTADWIVSSRSGHSEIAPDLKIVNLPPPSSDEVREIIKRLSVH